MLRSSSTVVRPIDLALVTVILLRLRVAVRGCTTAGADLVDIQTCVEDLTVDTESWRTIEALRNHYEDFPTHCRYGQ